MDEKTPAEQEAAERKAFRDAALQILSSLKPTVEGVQHELDRQQRHNLDHEYFLIHEFREFTKAVRELNATLARM